MKKYLAIAFMAIGLATTVYGLNSTNNSDESCNCSKTENCICKTACGCSSCGK